MKLFTAEIESKLQKQFPLGSNLESQQVICKIFNPYGRFTWYIVNQDPEDPDYLWAIVDGFEVEIGSVSKSELESIKVPPFGLPLERDRGFNPKNAAEVFRGLLEGKHYRSGGKTPNMATIESLPGKTMFLYHLGMDEPSLLTIKSARMSDPKYTVRSLFVESTEGGETRLDDGKVDEFLSGKTVALRDSQGEPYAVKLDTSMVKKAEGGYGHSDDDFTMAMKWWGNDLSLNEQKEIAAKHLLNFEYDMLMGNTAKYTSRNKWRSLIVRVWDKEGRPQSKVPGIYSEGGAVTKTDPSRVISLYEVQLDSNGRELMRLVAQALYSEEKKEEMIARALKATQDSFDSRYDYRQEVYVHPKKAKQPWMDKYKVFKDGGPIKVGTGVFGDKEFWRVTDGDRVATYPKDKFTEQEAIDAFAFAMESKKEQSGTFDPIKRIEEEGKLVRYVDTRGNGKKYFDTIIPNKKEPGYYKRYESTQKGVLGVLQNEFLDADDVRMWVEKTRPKSRMGEGGPATFDDKVKAISSSLEGTKVKPKYQKQYGKRYDKAEATEAATKIAEAMTAKERRKSILSKYKK